MESSQQINFQNSQFYAAMPLLALGTTAGFLFKNDFKNIFTKNFDFSFANAGFSKPFSKDFYSQKTFVNQQNIFNKMEKNGGAFNKQFFSASSAAASSAQSGGSNSTPAGEPLKKSLHLEKKLFISEANESGLAMTQVYKEKINSLIQQNIKQYKESQKYERHQINDQNAITSTTNQPIQEEISAATEQKTFTAGVRQHKISADFESIHLQKVKKNLGLKKMYEFEKYMKQNFALFPRNSKVKEKLFTKPLFWDFVEEWLQQQFKNYKKVALTPEFKMKPRIFQPVFATVEFVFKLSGKKK